MPDQSPEGARAEIAAISEIGIDGDGRLYVVPHSHDFPFIYREAMEVQWAPEAKRLYAPVPREWSYARWFEQIINAASAQEYTLAITMDTVWVNISDNLKVQMLAILERLRGA
jgi:hypothetical protein